MKYATIYTNYNRGYGFSSAYTICGACQSLLADKIYAVQKELSKKGIKILKIVKHNGQEEMPSMLIINL